MTILALAPSCGTLPRTIPMTNPFTIGAVLVASGLATLTFAGIASEFTLRDWPRIVSIAACVLMLVGGFVAMGA